MNDNTVSIEEFRANLAEYVNRVRYGRQHVVVKKHNRPAAVLMSSEEYEWLTDPAKRFTKKEWAEGFKVFEDLQLANVDKKPKEIESDVAKSIKEVRATRQRSKRRKK